MWNHFDEGPKFVDQKIKVDEVEWVFLELVVIRLGLCAFAWLRY
jgi:hypothetical protein